MVGAPAIARGAAGEGASVSVDLDLEPDARRIAAL
jgi:hypothetical protein